MELDLRNYSSKPVQTIRHAMKQPDHDYKPRGLWLSQGTEWLDWCINERFRLEKALYETRFQLTHPPTLIEHKFPLRGNVLWLRNSTDIDMFHTEFAQLPYRSDDDTGYTGWDDDLPTGHVGWIEVAKRFAGLVIAPYQWSRRLDGEASRWYYGWDVASGCVWRADHLTITAPSTMIPMSVLEREPSWA